MQGFIFLKQCNKLHMTIQNDFNTNLDNLIFFSVDQAQSLLFTV